MELIDFSSQKTHFASAPRASLKIVMEQHNSLKKAEFLEEVFTKIPVMFFIINQHRQIIYMNDLINKELQRLNIDLGLGFRPGEVLRCQNAFTEPAGCGTSYQCRLCGIVNTILEAVANDCLVIHEASFESNPNGDYQVSDYEVAAKPFYWQGEKYIIITFDNISQTKRKEHLEQTFFHDLLNKAMSVSGLSEILGNESDHSNEELIKLLRRGISDLTNEIIFQRSLTEAESGEFTPRFEALNSLEVIHAIKEDFLSYEVVSNKKVLISERSTGIDFLSDRVILNRILTNLVKNALEATLPGEVVTIGSKADENLVQFWVQNQALIPEEIKEQLFRRSFSTKGKGRGMGTYSVKLFTEQYLKGKVVFVSDNEQGTVFSIQLPVHLEEYFID